MTLKIDLSIEILTDLVTRMKNFNFIQFYSIPLTFIETDLDVVFPPIHSIELMKEFQSYTVIDKLTQLFPNIQRLKIKIKFNDDIHYILKAFSHSLSMVWFHSEKPTLTITKKSVENTLGHLNFTCHIDRNDIQLWIGLNKVCPLHFVFSKNVEFCFTGI